MIAYRFGAGKKASRRRRQRRKNYDGKTERKETFITGETKLSLPLQDWSARVQLGYQTLINHHRQAGRDDCSVCGGSVIVELRSWVAAVVETTKNAPNNVEKSFCPAASEQMFTKFFRGDIVRWKNLIGICGRYRLPGGLGRTSSGSLRSAFTFLRWDLKFFAEVRCLNRIKSYCSQRLQ